MAVNELKDYGIVEEFSELQEKVLEVLERDLVAAEMKIDLFMCALESYRYDSILRPYPPLGLREDGTKDVQKLTRLCNTLPKLSKIIEDKQETSVSVEGWQLLHWLLGKTFDIVTMDTSMFKEIERKTGEASYSSIEPDYVFEVQYHSSCALNKRFLDLAENYHTHYAYHGSGLDNFHSILHNGLHSHLNKNSLFGEGTYLSSDLNVSLPYSKYKQLWSQSAMGHKMSCVAVCEVLDHPDVKYTLQNKTASGGTQSSREHARARNSEGGDVPEKYYVVTNNELLRVKYLLVYVEKHKTERTSPGSWFTTIIIFYMFILVVLGFTRTRIYSNIHSKMFGSHTEF